jgi:hypothetical protein
VAVVVLCWNGREDTLECLASVERLTHSDVVRIVVDNGSTDGTPECVERLHPSFRVFRTGSNHGYAGGNNRGLEIAREAGAEFTLLLNNDATVEPGLLEPLLEAARRDPLAAAVGPCILSEAEPDRVRNQGFRWSARDHRFVRIGAGRPFDPTPRAAQPSDYVSGCALLVRNALLDEVGLLDEDYFLTYEEADWCVRARERGYRSLVVSHVRAWHKLARAFGGQRSALRAYFLARNRLLFARRRLPRRQRWRVYRDALAGLRAGPNEPVAMLRARRRGVLDFALGRTGDCPLAVREIR